MNAVVVDLIENGETWWWRVRDCKLARGPFRSRAEADDDASAVAPDLIATLVACQEV
jgi:hypothetical protein